MTNLDVTPRTPRQRPLIWSEAVLDLQERLLDAPFDTPLYLVGGAVRDAFLHRPIKDLDMAVPHDAIKTARKIANLLGADIFVMDTERGVARLYLETKEGRLQLDIADFRGEDLLADLLGRDFTLNAMACDFWGDLGQLIDPLNGEQDATIKLLRRCTEKSIADDPIRALRAIRQSVQLSLHIETETLKDIRAHQTAILETSPERIRDEFFALLSVTRPTAALRVADSLGILDLLIPELAALKGLALPEPHVFEAWKQSLETIERLSKILNTVSYQRNADSASSFDMGMLAIQFDRFRPQLNEHLTTEWANGRNHQALLIFGALLHTTGLTSSKTSAVLAAEIADKFRLSNPEKKRLVQMLEYYPLAQTIDAEDVLAVHRYWYQLEEAGLDACLIGLADYLATYGAQLKQDDWLIQLERAVLLAHSYFKQHDTVVAPPPLLNGNDIMTHFNLSGGRLIGELITALREAQVLGQVLSVGDALAFVADYLKPKD